MAVPGEAFGLALNTTLERMTGAGRTWCPQTAISTLPSLVAKRGPELNGLVRQAVRLQRLLASMDRRGGIAALYVDIRILRAQEFARVVDAALAGGALAGIAERAGDGVAFLEPSMQARSGRFDLTFAQMPFAAVLLDVVRNMLGFPAVADILAPLSEPRCTVPAEEIARALDVAVSAWLREHAEPEHLLKQKAFMFKFLGATREIAARSIDDAAVLEFWCWANGDASVCDLAPDAIDGFKTFRSAAQLMVVLRHALEDALDAERVRSARSLDGGEHPFEDLPAGDSGDSPGGAHASPAWARMTSPPVDAVKWVKSEDDRKIIGDLLPGREGGSDEGAGRQDLFDGAIPHPDLLLTFVRYATFGRIQTAISTALRFKRSAVAVSDDPLYETLLKQVLRIRSALHETGLACAHVLLAKGRQEGLELARSLDPTSVDRAIEAIGAGLGSGRAALGTEAVLSLLVRTLANPREPFGKAAKEAFGRIERAGFRETDRDDPMMVEALAVGSEWLPSLMADLDRLTRGLGRLDLAAALEADRPVFERRFASIYAAAEPAAASG